MCVWVCVKEKRREERREEERRGVPNKKSGRKRHLGNFFKKTGTIVFAKHTVTELSRMLSSSSVGSANMWLKRMREKTTSRMRKERAKHKVLSLSPKVNKNNCCNKQTKDKQKHL